MEEIFDIYTRDGKHINMREKYVKNLDKNYSFSKNGFNVILPKIDNKDVSICFVDVDKERVL